MGCPIQFFPGAFGRRRLLGIIENTAIVQIDENDGSPEETFDMDYEGLEKAKPILRRLESMTEEEKVAYENMSGMLLSRPIENAKWWTADAFHWACSMGFDLFGLIDSNQAIDAATLPSFAQSK